MSRGSRWRGGDQLCEMVGPRGSLQPKHLFLPLFYKWGLCRKHLLCKCLEHVGSYWKGRFSSFPSHFFWVVRLHFCEDSGGAFDWHPEWAQLACITACSPAHKIKDWAGFLSCLRIAGNSRGRDVLECSLYACLCLVSSIRFRESPFIQWRAGIGYQGIFKRLMSLGNLTRWNKMKQREYKPSGRVFKGQVP